MNLWSPPKKQNWLFKWCSSISLRAYKRKLKNMNTEKLKFEDVTETVNI